MLRAPKNFRPAWLLLVASVLALFRPSIARAHELAVDRLTLFPDVERGHVRGQILFDPKLTRANNDEGLERISPRVVGFLRDNLALEVDGTRVPITFEVRELWAGDGALEGDSVMLDAALPKSARELRVFAGVPLRALAVSIESVRKNERFPPQNALLLGGELTPPYRLLTPIGNGGWAEGDPDLVGANIPRHRDAPAAATPAPPSAPGATPRSGFARESAWVVAGRYVRLGVAHILPHGWDHVLFVAGLVLGSRRKLRALLPQLGAFTVAHTVTLGLGALGLVVLPGGVIEPLIAFSIAFVALENLLKRGEPRYRTVWAFAFGLLHGQGFAGALAETGIPRESFLTALLSFNVGVELGQLAVVGALLVLLRGLDEPDRFQRYALRPGSVVIAMMGLYWAVERLVA
ncbi:MAG TPA: HupE/UreJ family protein [Polyangiaceae bacterium]